MIRAGVEGVAHVRPTGGERKPVGTKQRVLHACNLSCTGTIRYRKRRLDTYPQGVFRISGPTQERTIDSGRRKPPTCGNRYEGSPSACHWKKKEWTP